MKKFRLVNPGKKLTVTKFFVYAGVFAFVLGAYFWYSPRLLKKPAGAAPRAGSQEDIALQAPDVLDPSKNVAPLVIPGTATATQAPIPPGVPSDGPFTITPGTVPEAVYGQASPAPPLPMTPSGA